MIKRAFVIAAFGERSRQAQRLIKNIRSYSDLPIHILTTKDSYIGSFRQENINIEYVERQWPKGSYREGIRNSNYHKINFALEHRHESLCLLDDDMHIVNALFVEGFEIAERFGVAIPNNPRVFNGYNMMGADVSSRDREMVLSELKIPPTIPAVNFSPFFTAPILAGKFLTYLKNELKNVACRGTVAIIKAMWNSKFTPVILPEQWCVCGSNAQYIKDYTKVLKGKTINIPPIMLHLGHDEVRKVFADVIEEN